MRRWLAKKIIRWLGLEGVSPEVRDGLVRRMNELTITVAAMMTCLREGKYLHVQRFQNELKNQTERAQALVAGSNGRGH